MKTKFVKVPVSERLPEKEGCYPIIFKNTDIIRDYYRGKNILSEEFWKIHIEYWLEEKEDHSEEMLSLLEKSRKIIQSLKLSMLVHPDCEEGSEFDDYTTSAQETENQIEELINKVKDNGTK
ncbi:hypothetical protein CMU73_05655 [Elizabethkingia anophelis]|uniref:hypothetical protein n=1 Tax=Elizabethkingia anophelis TaxID=1117645 RepID=UPI000998F221|nr:hypothetical protein [Elizabethkingia anophelis]MCT3926907.1 hypothetical protein [Elizabethkingia anophelis]MCT4101707.1 hypothetical protein [Elizabethkingia anophelis]MCT4166031.1 hypothetical protein [Elizabethkingia anophelis]MDV3551045.1 hypothetical protein [Elizabethkingia anophelis]MDV3570127.1 hypothetical protein [Elizabethkingia anophelis]